MLSRARVRSIHMPPEDCADMEEWGHGKVILKSDGEPATRALKKKVRRRREDVTLMEVTPRADPKANGEAEAAVREIKGVARAIKVGLEQRLRSSRPADSPILPWIIEHSGVCITVFRKDGEGKTAYQKLRGKGFSGVMFEIGEKVLFKELNDQRQIGGWDGRWSEGIWVGYDIATYQSLVWCPGRVVKANSLKRVPEEDRWDAEEIDAIDVKPWEDGKTTAARKSRSRIPEERAEKQKEEVPPMTTDEEKKKDASHKGPRSFTIFKDDV